VQSGSAWLPTEHVDTAWATETTAEPVGTLRRGAGRALRRGAGRALRLRLVAGIVLVALTGVAVVYPLWWDHRSSTQGHVLLQRGLDASGLDASGRATSGHDANGRATSGRCDTPADEPTTATPAHPAVLEIPSIGLQAPVVGGMSTSVLAVAVGHDPSTVWPGARGESILLAHDVSYFSGLSRVRAGALVIWELGCEEMDFRVRTTAVTTPGAQLQPPSSGSGIALVTCWPTNALFWTTQRFVVEATLETVRHLRVPSGEETPSLVRLRVPAPPALAATGLALGESGAVVGTLAITGAPSRTFTEGPQALAVEGAALEDYAAAAKTAAAANESWWSALAVPGVALPTPWPIGDVTDVTLTVKGSTVQRVVLTSAAATVTLTVRRGELLVTAVAS